MFLFFAVPIFVQPFSLSDYVNTGRQGVIGKEARQPSPFWPFWSNDGIKGCFPDEAAGTRYECQ